MHMSQVTQMALARSASHYNHHSGIARSQAGTGSTTTSFSSKRGNAQRGDPGAAQVDARGIDDDQNDLRSMPPQPLSQQGAKGL